MIATATPVATEIRHANDLFEASFERSDAAAIANLYTPNGVLLPTGMGTIEGTADIQAFWEGAMAMGIKQVQLHTQELEEMADTAIELGHYTLLGADTQMIDQGKYLVV
ncbi:YybH family protein [Hymenobacter ruber]